MMQSNNALHPTPLPGIMLCVGDWLASGIVAGELWR